MSYTEQKALAVADPFINRVEMAAVIVAIVITNEDATTPGHDKRTLFAAQVLRDSRDQARILAHGVAGDSAITRDSIDSVIAARLNVIWNPYAGYNPNDPRP